MLTLDIGVLPLLDFVFVGAPAGRFASLAEFRHSMLRGDPMEPSGLAAPAPSYETVAPLLARSRVDGAGMEYVFRCPVTGFEVTASAASPQYAGPDIPDMFTAEQWAKHMANPHLGIEAQIAADRVVPWSGTIASVGNSLRRLRRGNKENRSSNQTSLAAGEEAARQMLVTAFGTVAGQFAWDASGGRWVKAGG